MMAKEFGKVDVVANGDRHAPGRFKDIYALAAHYAQLLALGSVG